MSEARPRPIRDGTVSRSVRSLPPSAFISRSSAAASPLSANGAKRSAAPSMRLIGWFAGLTRNVRHSEELMARPVGSSLASLRSSRRSGSSSMRVSIPEADRSMARAHSSRCAAALSLA